MGGYIAMMLAAAILLKWVARLIYELKR